MRRIQKILIGIFLGGVLLGGIGTGIAFVEYSSFAYAGEKKVGEEYLVTRDFEYTFDPGVGKVKVGCGWWARGVCTSRIETDETVPRGMVRYEVTYNEKTVRPYLVYNEYTDSGYGAFPMEAVEVGRTDMGGGEGTGERAGTEPDEGTGERAGTGPGGGSNEVTYESMDIETEKNREKEVQAEDVVQGELNLWVDHISSGFALWMECKDEVLGELKQRRISDYEIFDIMDIRIKVHPETVQYLVDETGC